MSTERLNPTEYARLRAAELARGEAFETSPLGLVLRAVPNRERFDWSPDGHPGYTLDGRGIFALLEYVAGLEQRVALLEGKMAEASRLAQSAHAAAFPQGGGR